MPETKISTSKKTKKSDSSSTKKSPSRASSELKKVKVKKAPAEASLREKTPKKSSKSISQASFTVKQLEDFSAPQSAQKEKKVPTWMVLLFMFSLVFFLFALYKAFIYGQGYGDEVHLSLPLEQQQEAESQLFEPIQNTENAEISQSPELQMTES